MTEETKSVEQYLEDLEKGIESFNTKFEPVEMQFKTMTERIDALETKINTPETGAAPVVKDAEAEWTKAYCDYLHTGKQFDQEYFVGQVKDANPAKYKTLASDDLTTGGYFMPVTMSNRIIEALVNVDPFRGECAVETLRVGDTLEMLGEVGATLAAWTSERATRSATANLTLNKVSIPTHPMYAMPVLTQKMARMSSFDVEAWMVRKVTEYMGYLEGVAFLTGTGVGQPEGLITYAKSLAEGSTADERAIDSGATTSIPDTDCLISVQDLLDTRFQGNAKWYMARKTKTVLRKFTDGEGRYILQENITLGQPDTLFGKPIVYCDSMNTVSSGSTFTQEDIPIIYGDMRQAYQIVDVPNMISIRDEITTKGAVSLYTERMGVGGQVVNKLAYMALEIDT
jgi:HK97 family phage major capsid protein